MNSQQKILKRLPQIPPQQQVKVREEHVVTHYGMVGLQTDTLEYPIKGRRNVMTVFNKLPYCKELYSYVG